ncbi:MAG: hypothetical protein ACK45R_10160 [Candidatus Kapaibacterium sp.]|jgi:hypothetical protein
MPSRLSSPSFVVAVLVITQMISLMSVLAWAAIATVLLRADNSLEVAGSLYVVYPALPVAFSALAWFAYRIKRYLPAVILSAIPAAVALVLMVYYYIVGLMSHA